MCCCAFTHPAPLFVNLVSASVTFSRIAQPLALSNLGSATRYRDQT